MAKLLAERVLNVALRSLALGSRFALIFVMAKLLEPADVGSFGLMLATVSFSMLMIGGDFYTYSQRELLSLPKERWSFVLQHQMIATGMLYVVLLPAQMVIFWFGLLSYTVLFWFFALLVVEHIGQEINRLLVAMQRPIVASGVLFVRMAAWVWIILPLMWLSPDPARLETVYLAWLLGGVVAMVLGVIVIRSEITPWKSWKLDWQWMRQGFKIGIVFLFGTLCFKALFTADRYLVEYFVGAEWLGAYVLYVGMALVAVNFLDPAVFSFLYPRMVAAYRQGDMPRYKMYLREMSWSAIGVSLILALGIVILSPWVLGWLDREIYLEHISVLWILLAVAVIYAAGMIPHYGLYAQGRDKAIVVAHITSVLVFAMSAYLFSKIDIYTAVPLALLVAFSWMGLYKYLAYRSTKLEHPIVSAVPVANSGDS